MLSNQKPKLMPVAFAASGAKQEIPVASQISIAAGRASYTDGFPPLTRTPLSAGGIPPYGTDFNGVLNEITAAIRWANAGMGYMYDAAFSTSVGGYPKGAQLTKATSDGLWLNTVESNTSNPDTGGAGWLDMTTGRLIGIQRFTSSGTYTPSPGAKKYRRRVWGGGGGGGGAAAITAVQAAVGGGGTSGAYVESFDVIPGGALSVIVGTGGVSGVGVAGSNGGTSSVGGVSAPGGTGGELGVANSSFPFATPSSFPPTGTGGNIINAPGQAATIGFGVSADGTFRAMGGMSSIGSSIPFAASVGYCAGGTGGSQAGSLGPQAAISGYAGAPGLVIIEEYS